MTAPKLSARANALLPLATGKSQADVAREVGVSRSTVAAWMSNPDFVAEVDRLKLLVEARPVDGKAVLAAVMEARRRINPPAPSAGGRVVVSFPADASPARLRRLLARGIAKAMDLGGDGER